MLSKWDARFLRLAKEVAHWSKDPSTQVGAVIVRDRRILATGYNGFPARMHDRQEWLNDRTEKLSRTIHAELNALIEASRQRVSVAGGTVYTWPFFCCKSCVIHLTQAGIYRFVAPELDRARFGRWADELDASAEMAREMGGRVCLIP